MQIVLLLNINIIMCHMQAFVKEDFSVQLSPSVCVVIGVCGAHCTRLQ